MILHHVTHLPAFGFDGIKHGYPICIMTVLSANDKVGDCAAYEGVVPANDAEVEGAVHAVKRNGNKISEEKAKMLFPEIKAQGWRYRL